MKGLPITVEVEELNEQGEVQRREVLSSYEDAYTAEFQALHGCLVSGKQIKTSLQDAKQDIELFDQMYKMAFPESG